MRVWNDVANNGVIDVGTDTIVQGTMTDSSGNYIFKHVSAGNYIVEAYDPTSVLLEGSFTTTHPIDTTVVATAITGQSIGYNRVITPSSSAGLSASLNVKIDENTANGATAASLAASDFYGRSVANLGDLNNDGVIDILVGTMADE